MKLIQIEDENMFNIFILGNNKAKNKLEKEGCLLELNISEEFLHFTNTIKKK